MAPSESSPLRRTFPVPGGPSVRLRLAGRSDRRLISALLERRGLRVGDLELGRLLAYDPARRQILCALAPIDGHETLVGLGAIDLGADAPDALVVDERMPAVAEVLGRVLVERARRRSAA